MWCENFYYLVENSPAFVLASLEASISSLSSVGLLLYIDLATRLANLDLTRSVGLGLNVYHILLAHSPNLISNACNTSAPYWLYLTIVNSGLRTLLIDDMATKRRRIKFLITMRNMHVLS